jgi:hypothetical protein
MNATADTLAREAARYLETVELFACHGADPHASARARAADKRQNEASLLRRERKGVSRWVR